ncbi:MAG TPA: AraC family transcriptional regulator [Syntrophomonadaceae bacterium]|nr:AraC family transcriptional regulator [Syntrophomonadaceae bacterium]
MNDIVDNAPKEIASLQALFRKEELLAKVIEHFPYPIQVYAPNGTSVLVNQALLNEYRVSDPDMIVGRYNILKDPDIIKTGQLPMLKRAFQGETVFFPEVKVPLEEIARKYDIHDFNAEAVYQDITVFPILDDFQQVTHVVALLINRRVYRGQDEIERAKEYIETHWLDKFDANATAKAAFLSKAHFTKLFKKQIGVTPHEYYINYKISKLKERLLDTNLSIAQAFAACNMNYNSHSVRVFKSKTGNSPSDYRKSQLNDE